MKSVKYNFYKIFINLTPFYFCYYIIYRYNERDITLIDYLDFSKKMKTQIMNTYFSFKKILKMQLKTSTIIYLMQICSLVTFQVIRKCMWSTPSTVKTTATSLKKFYKSMAEHGKIEKKDYDYVCHDIKESMAYWQECCAEYNNPDFLY